MDKLPACLGSLYSGLGHSFYLHVVNLLDPTMHTSRRRIFRNTALETCATKSPSGWSQKYFQVYDTATSTINAWSTGISTSGNGTIAAISGFSLAATCNAKYENSSFRVMDLGPLSLDYLVLDALVDQNQTSKCWS